MFDVNVTLSVEADNEEHARRVVADRLRDAVNHDRQWSDVLDLEHQGRIDGFRLTFRVDAEADRRG